MVSVVTGAVDINSDPGCFKVTDLDMTLSSSSGPDNTMAPGENEGHSDQHGHGGSSMAFRHPHGHRFWSRPWAPMWSLLATWTTDINTDLGCDKTTDPDMVLCLSPDSPWFQVA